MALPLMRHSQLWFDRARLKYGQIMTKIGLHGSMWVSCGLQFSQAYEHTVDTSMYIALLLPVYSTYTYIIIQLGKILYNTQHRSQATTSLA